MKIRYPIMEVVVLTITSLKSHMRISRQHASNAMKLRRRTKTVTI